MSLFKRRVPRVPEDARRAQREAHKGLQEAQARGSEVSEVVTSLQRLHRENHLAEAIIDSMSLRPKIRRPWRT